MVYYILFCHFICDYPMQLPWMATKKAHEWIPLLFHVGVYTLVFGLLLIPFCETSDVLKFTIINGLAHLFVDSYTAPIAAKMAELKDKRYFYWTLGADQVLHTYCLIFTVGLL